MALLIAAIGILSMPIYRLLRGPGRRMLGLRPGDVFVLSVGLLIQTLGLSIDVGSRPAEILVVLVGSALIAWALLLHFQGRRSAENARDS